MGKVTILNQFSKRQMREKQDSENNVHKVNFTERKKLKEFTFQNKNPSRRGSDEEEIGVSKSKQTFQDDSLDDKGDFLNVDQMITPAHSSFENEHDYQLV